MLISTVSSPLFAFPSLADAFHTLHFKHLIEQGDKFSHKHFQFFIFLDTISTWFLSKSILFLELPLLASGLLTCQFSSKHSLRSLFVPTVSPSLLERHAGMSCSIWLAHSSLTDLTNLINCWAFIPIVSKKNSSSSTLAHLEYLHKLVSSRPFCRWLHFWAVFFFNLCHARNCCYNREDSLRLFILKPVAIQCYGIHFCDISSFYAVTYKLALSLSFLPVSNILRKAQTFAILTASWKKRK